MNYIGDLYGKVNGKYIKLEMTSSDVDLLENEKCELLGIIQKKDEIIGKMKNCNDCKNFCEYLVCVKIDGTNRTVAQKKVKGCRFLEQCKNNELLEMKKKTFEEWKADNSHEIEDLADYFMRHDTEDYFVHDKYLEAYEKIELLCKLAFDRE